MAALNCPICKGSLAKSANSCPGCGYVPPLTRARSIVLAMIAGSWAVIAYVGPNAPLSPMVQNATIALVISFVSLTGLLLFSLIREE